MPGSLRHPRAESGRLRSPLGGRSPGPLSCSQAPGFAPSRPAPPHRQAPARPPRASLVAFSPLRWARSYLSPAWIPPSPVASPTVRLPLASAPRPLASCPLLFLPPLPFSPSSAPRPSACCRLPPPRSTAQTRARSPHPGRAEPPLPAPRLAAVRGAHRRRPPPQLGENRGSGRRRLESRQPFFSSLL